MRAKRRTRQQSGMGREQPIGKAVVGHGDCCGIYEK